MPAVEDLPELLPEKEFLARFGGVGTPRYEALLEEIDRRVAVPSPSIAEPVDKPLSQT